MNSLFEVRVPYAGGLTAESLASNVLHCMPSRWCRPSTFFPRRHCTSSTTAPELRRRRASSNKTLSSIIPPLPSPTSQYFCLPTSLHLFPSSPSCISCTPKTPPPARGNTPYAKSSTAWSPRVHIRHGSRLMTSTRGEFSLPRLPNNNNERERERRGRGMC